MNFWTASFIENTPIYFLIETAGNSNYTEEYNTLLYKRRGNFEKERSI
jgi:hypothetical protein